MAIGIHVARVAFIPVDSAGNRVDKDADDTTLKDMLRVSHEHRVLEDSAIPNTTGHPTVKDYLEAEANNNFVLEYMDQNAIITYHRTSSGGFTS